MSKYPRTLLTEEQIDLQVEHMTDATDKAFQSGNLSQAEYDRRIKNISEWADAQLRLIGDARPAERLAYGRS